MGQKQCAKCGETVDEAKAFCPECGSAFEEEKKRTSVSEFDRSSKTVQLGQTMFNQMLSDMGLNISKEPKPQPPEKGRVEVIAPVVQPAAPQSSGPKNAPQPQARSGSRIWIIVGVLAAILAFALAVIVVAVALLLYFRQTD